MSALSQKHLDLIRRIAQGDSSKQIATALGSTKNAVDRHRQRMMVKLGAKTSPHMVYIAIQRGLIS